MIEAEFKRDLNNNHMIFNCPEEVSLNNYQIAMIRSNTIGGMLKCNVRTIDNKSSLYYEITSKQPLERVFEKQLMKYRDIQKLITGIKAMIEKVEEYLLDCNSLLIEPEYIYMNVETEEMYFCYIPGYQKAITSSFHQLAEFVFNKIDHKDKEGVVLGYELYQQTLGDNYSISSIMEHFYKKKKTIYEEYEEEIIEESLGEDGVEAENEISDQEYKKDIQSNGIERYNKKTKSVKDLVIGIMITLLVVFIIGYFMISRYIIHMNLIQIFGGVLLLGSLLLYLYIQKIKKQKEDLNKESVVVQIEEDTNEKEDKEEVIYGKMIRKSEKEIFGNTSLLAFKSQGEGRKLVSLGMEEDLIIINYPYLIGKIETIVDGVVPNHMVSRIHAKITKEEGKFYITDLNSTNGTFLNSKRMESNATLELKIGDELCFGELKFCFK